MKVSSGGRILGPDAVDPVAKCGGWGFDSAAQPCRALALAQSSRSPCGGDRVRLLTSLDERDVGRLRLGEDRSLHLALELRPRSGVARAGQPTTS
jgi:hypothetical protein